MSVTDTMRHRLRIRFRKQGDLRLISHRDLARLWERIFRRAGLRLTMSEGFHPKAKLSFPSALSLGIAGIDEVLEVEVNEVELNEVEVNEIEVKDVEPNGEPNDVELPDGARKDGARFGECADKRVLRRLAMQAPAGLTIDRIERLPPGARKAQVSRLTYEVPVPAERLHSVAHAIAALLQQPEVWIARPGRAARLDVRANLDHLALEGGRLVMCFRAVREATAGPRDVLQLLGLGDVEACGVFLTRTRVELA